MPSGQVLAQQALDRFGDKRCGAAVSNGARDGRVLADCSAETEVVSVGQLALELDFLAFHADVGNPMLSAAIGAAGDMELELLVKLRQALFKFIDEPAREAFCLSDCELAELRACAGDCAAPEWGALYLEADLGQFLHQLQRFCCWGRR